MHKMNDSHEKVLRTAIRLARDVLQECATTKLCTGAQPWVFALLARMASGALSVETLLRHNHLLDAKLIVRAVQDALIDLHYIVHDPLREDGLLELLRLEVAEDRYEQAQFFANFHNEQLNDVGRRHPVVQSAIDEYARARQHKAFRKRPEGIPKRRWPKRWRSLSTREKVRATEFKELWEQSFGFTITHLGNAAAHSRYLSLKYLMEERGESEICFVLRPRGDRLLAKGWISFETAVCLLVSCDTVIDKYYLTAALSGRVQRLLRRLKRLAKIAREGGKAQTRSRGYPGFAKRREEKGRGMR